MAFANGPKGLAHWKLPDGNFGGLGLQLLLKTLL